MYIDSLDGLTVESILVSINNVLFMWFFAWLMFTLYRTVINNLRGAFKKWRK